MTKHWFGEKAGTVGADRWLDFDHTINGEAIAIMPSIAEMSASLDALHMNYAGMFTSDQIDIFRESMFWRKSFHNFSADPFETHYCGCDPTYLVHGGKTVPRLRTVDLISLYYSPTYYVEDSLYIWSNRDRQSAQCPKCGSKNDIPLYQLGSIYSTPLNARAILHLSFVAAQSKKGQKRMKLFSDAGVDIATVSDFSQLLRPEGRSL